MGTNEVFAISNKPGEVTLKGFNYMKECRERMDVFSSLHSIIS